MISISDKRLCCGCSACASVCPKDAITMRPDPLGFLYPEVDPSLCVECGLCVKVCDFTDDAQHRHSDVESLEVLAARTKDEKALSGSQSGGVFPILADKVLSRGGVVYGAAFNEDFSVSHRRAETVSEALAFRGSKYVESRIDGVFRMVKDDLGSGRTVLFSGTPCQVAGLHSYLPENLKKDLYLVDIVCHGVPSPSIWKDYVSYNAGKGTVVKADFRDKGVGGWKIHKESFEYSNGYKCCSESYKTLFYKNIMLRKSCEICPYDISVRYSDITIADFWGIGEIFPDMDDDKGISMVVCNSPEGAALFESVSEHMYVRKASVSAGFLEKHNPNMLHHSVISPERDELERMYVTKGLGYVMRRWSDRGWRYRLWKVKVFLKGIAGLK